MRTRWHSPGTSESRDLAMQRERLLDLLVARHLRQRAEGWLELACAPWASAAESDFSMALRLERIAYFVERGLLTLNPIQAEGWR